MIEITGWLAVIAGLIAIYYWLEMMFTTSVSAGLQITLVLNAVVSVVTSVLVAQIAWRRASTIRSLPFGPYPVVRAASVLARMFGEIGGVGAVTGGLMSAFAIWFLGDADSKHAFGLGALFFPFLPPHFGATDSVAGVMILVRAFVYAMLTVGAGYVASEWLMVLLDTAARVTELAQSTRPAGLAEPSASAPAEGPVRFCVQCGAEVSADRATCPKCNAAV